MTFVYINNTGVDVSYWHDLIVKATYQNGHLPDDIADLFLLTWTPAGEGRLDWA